MRAWRREAERKALRGDDDVRRLVASLDREQRRELARKVVRVASQSGGLEAFARRLGIGD